MIITPEGEARQSPEAPNVINVRHHKRKIREFLPDFSALSNIKGPSAATLERCAFCTAALVCVAAFHADLSGMALAIVIIHTFCRLAVYRSAVGSHFHRIAVASFFSLLKTVAACLLCCFCGVPSDLDLVKCTQELIVVYTGLYRTF